MGKRLLVVDSDRRFIQDHKSPLESAFEVDFIFTTEGALTRLESGDYGAVLLCVETSENKGYALCAAIRRTLGDLKIALISAKASEEEYARHRGTKGRADLYLHKPISSGALVPALAEFVPMREDDPDNPLGDLAGTDLGDEWLESLKTELDTDLSVPAPIQPRTIAPAPAWTLLPPPLPAPAERATPAASQGDVELLEWRIKELELKLATYQEELERKNREIEELIRNNAAVTRNLDEAQQAQTAAAVLTQKFLEQEGAAARLRDELQAALDEQKRQVDLLEEVNALLNEKALQNAELMETHQLLQAQLEEAWEKGDQVRTLEGALAEAKELQRGLEDQAALAGQERNAFETERAATLARLRELEAGEERAAELARDLDALRAGHEAQAARIQDLEADQERASALEMERDGLLSELVERTTRIHELENAQDQAGLVELELEGLRADLADKSARIQELEAAQGRAADQERALASALDQVSFQDLTIRNLAEERSTLQAERERQEEVLNEQAGELMVLQEKLALLETSGRDALEERDRLREVRMQLEAAVADLGQRLDLSEAAHEQQRHELLAGIDEREAHLSRLNSTLDAQRERIGQMEREREGLDARLQGSRDHLDTLTGVLTELESKTRQALDLAKAAIH